MMIRIGNFFFKYRNALFPIVFALMLFEETWPAFPSEEIEDWLVGGGLVLAIVGQMVRAAVIGLVYVKRGGKDKKVYAENLVTSGLFAHCRNPLYVGNLMIIIGVGIASNSLPFWILGFPFFVFAYAAIILAEENYLRGKFGQEYEDYCARVHRMLPSLTGIRQTFSSTRFHWRRLVVKEYPTAFVWVAGFVLLMIKDQYWDWGYASHKKEIWQLLVVLLFATLAFLVARILKKTKTLRAD